ncbi:hypothetical protein RclHR1_07880004 [Rhizophagus clarus]|uniref:Carbohydrate-binding module family 13 protein n=1 Tax=Rhizophagus clarus TaxID=94130 RepID=A0A2Z6SDF0_9GLOM|nr:hypothetical protein RclHR1_07880004 [Rhizophagus clarus]GES89978.1 carbohydrate-binding module family 13 protein [Rhizophagus clarus]
MDDNNFLPKLSQNLLEILNDEEYYDIAIEVGKDPHVKVFRAHMIILYYRSPYLQRILSTNKKKNDGTLTHIKLPNISPEIFQIILRFIYGGRLSLKEYDTSDIIKILISASKLSLQELVTFLQSFLIKNKTDWMEQNFNFIYQTSFSDDSFVELQNYCTDLIAKEPDKLFKSPNFYSTSEKLLVTIIQNDNLKMSEIQVWEHVIKWGLAQNPELSSDITNFSKNDFDILKDTIQQCILFIKFYNLTSKEFITKVLPYKRILSKELYEDLLNTYLNLLDPDIKPSDKSKRHIVTDKTKSRTVDSKIITYQHTELISKWIDKLNISGKLTSSYNFKLIFRGSRDGFSSDRFHRICDYRTHMITIIKVKDSSEILGGYNPIQWKSGGCYGTTKDSFIFSFNNDDGIDNYILSRVTDENHAIFDSLYFGPSFGTSDISIRPIFDSNICRKSSYEKPIRKTDDEFIVEDCEIFQISHN